MKKVFNLLLIAVLAVVTAFSAVGCTDNSSNKNSKTGISGSLVEECVYEIRHYYAEDGVDTLDIGQFKLPAGATEIRIKKNAFKDNDTLKSIVVPATVTEIEAGAFSNMQVLESIELPFVGRYANADAYYKESAAAEKKAVDSERTIAHVFGTEEYTDGSAVTIDYGAGTVTCYMPMTLNKIVINAEEAYSIPMYAFKGMAKCEVELKGNIQAIGTMAFASTGFLSITLPATVKTIYDGAFDGASIQSVIFADGASGITVNKGAFANCKLLKKVGLSSVAANTIDFSVFAEVADGAFDMANDVKYSAINADGFVLEDIFGSIFENVN